MAGLSFDRAPDRGPAFDRNFVAICAANFAAMGSFYLLFPVAPLLVTGAGGSGWQASLTTGAIMFTTLLAEGACGFLQRRFSVRQLLAAGFLLLGLPGLLMGSSGSVIAILALSGVRGLGLGVVLVVSAAAIAQALPESRRSAGMSIYGVIVSTPAILMLPAGPWLLSAIGPTMTAAIGGASAILAIPLLRYVRADLGSTEDHAGLLNFVSRADAIRPAITMLWIAVAAGICTSLLPLVKPWADATVLAAGLLAHSLCAIAGRGGSGFVPNPANQRYLICGGVLLTVAGLLTLAVASAPMLLVASMALLGAGFGLVQNPTLVLLLRSAGPSASGHASVVWNFSYDAGLGIGAMLFGAIASGLGAMTTLLLIAGLTGLLLIGRTRPRLARRADSALPVEEPALATTTCP